MHSIGKLNDQTIVNVMQNLNENGLSKSSLIKIKHRKPIKWIIERGGLTVKDALSIRCWTKMLDCLAVCGLRCSPNRSHCRGVFPHFLN